MLNFFFFISYYFWIYPKDIYPQPYFLEDLKSTIDIIEDMNTENRSVYYDVPIIYYLLAEEVSHYDVYAEGGLEKASVLHNSYFLMIHEEDDLKENCYYVVGHTYHTIENKLIAAGYTPIISEDYDIYYIP